MKKIFIILAAAAATMTVSCNKNVQVDPAKPIAIEPLITRATETDFESGDKIGVTILQGETPYVTNECMTYDGDAFKSELCWYTEGEQNSKFVAYYPYAETVPTTFTVAADQSGEGYAAADLMTAVKDQVVPQASVAMVFKHMMTRIVINIDNQVNAKVSSLLLKNAVLSASVDVAAQSVEVAAGVEAEAITPSTVTADKKYAAIVVPQTVAFQLYLQVENGKKTITKTLNETTLKQGGQYTINVSVLPGDIKVTMSGEIENWSNEGEILEDGEAPEINYIDYGDHFEYYGENYNTVVLDDGNRWMAENMRYVPKGLTPCKDLNNVTAGVYYPVIAGETAAEFSESEAVIKAQGYLYQMETVLGVEVNSLKSEAEAKALEGAQGICPEGWHVPTIDELVGLVGKAVSPVATVTTAPYYNGSNGSLKMLNDDGFNLGVCGAISIVDNTRTAATLMGRLAAYPDRITSGYYAGSSFAGITYNTAGNADSGIKNIQFWGLMPMSNKATEDEYTCNGSKVSYKIASALRCVANK